MESLKFVLLQEFRKLFLGSNFVEIDVVALFIENLLFDLFFLHFLELISEFCNYSKVSIGPGSVHVVEITLLCSASFVE